MNKVLLISRIPPNNATTIEDHVNAIVELSNYEVKNIDVNDPNLKIEISKTDCIVLHYSIIAYPYRHDHIVRSDLRLQISRAGKPVLHIVQDEQRNALERFRYFETLGVRHVFSVAKQEVCDLMYPVNLRNFTVSTILTGYMPMNLNGYNLSEWDKRSTDIGYRARRLPEWYGELGFIKSNISDRLNEVEKNTNLVINASCEEDDRLYGQEWIDFLCDSKVAVGTESGSSTIDMDGRHLEEWQPKSKIGSHQKVEPLSSNYAAISPRIFEYAAAKCLIALTPGDYSGVLSPGVHYFELQPDLSNLEDLLTLMNNTEERTLMIERSYEDLILSGNFGYQQMVQEIDNQLDLFLKTPETLQVLGQATSNIVSKVDHTEQLTNLQKHLSFREKITRVIKSLKSKIFYWGLSRRGVSRTLLRLIFRILRKMWTTKLVNFLKLLSTSNSNVSKDYKVIFRITRRIFISAKLITDLEILRSEAKIVSYQGETLKILHGNASFWISWPESLDQSNPLKEHPRLDSIYFPEASGVWFTRSDFSEVNKPQQLKSLSRYYKRNKDKTLSLIQIYCGPFSM
jgi:hypothetical protein